MAKKTRKEDGTWKDGAASPELKPEHLRKLPAEWVTKDSDDPDRVHEDDAPHIVRSLAKEQAKPVEEKKDLGDELKKLWSPGPGEKAPVKQWFVDVTRTRVGLSWMRSIINQLAESNLVNAAEVAEAIIAGERLPDFEGYLEFPDVHNVNHYGLRFGLDQRKNWQKPKELRGIDASVLPFDPPKAIVKALAERGIDYNPRKKFAEAWAKQQFAKALEV